ncbi:hypothetical protein ACP3UH_31305, partial [Klebsiella pneumoniae]
TKQGRDWQKDMEMCEKASPAPWKIDLLEYMGNRGLVHETVIDGVTSEIYNEEDAEFIAESREALPYWLEVNHLKQRKILSLRARLSAAKEREKKLREAIEQTIKDMGGEYYTKNPIVNRLMNVLYLLYPDKEGEAK